MHPNVIESVNGKLLLLFGDFKCSQCKCNSSGAPLTRFTCIYFAGRSQIKTRSASLSLCSIVFVPLLAMEIDNSINRIPAKQLLRLQRRTDNRWQQCRRQCCGTWLAANELCCRSQLALVYNWIKLGPSRIWTNGSRTSTRQQPRTAKRTRRNNDVMQPLPLTPRLFNYPSIDGEF